MFNKYLNDRGENMIKRYLQFSYYDEGKVNQYEVILQFDRYF